jgi:hypothetical protein
VIDGDKTNVFEHFEVQHFETYESADADPPDTAGSPTGAPGVDPRA